MFYSKVKWLMLYLMHKILKCILCIFAFAIYLFSIIIIYILKFGIDRIAVLWSILSSPEAETRGGIFEHSSNSFWTQLNWLWGTVGFLSTGQPAKKQV